MAMLPVIRLLLDATRRGLLRWERHKKDQDLYEGSLDHHDMTVRFVRFKRQDGKPPDRHLAELTAFGVTTDHAVGTEGMDLINQMLAFHDPRWSETRGEIRRRLSEAEEMLQVMLERVPPTPMTTHGVRSRGAAVSVRKGLVRRR